MFFFSCEFAKLRKMGGQWALFVRFLAFGGSWGRGVRNSHARMAIVASSLLVHRIPRSMSSSCEWQSTWDALFPWADKESCWQQGSGQWRVPCKPCKVLGAKDSSCEVYCKKDTLMTVGRCMNLPP